MNIVGFFAYQKVDKTLSIWTVVFVAILSVQLMTRITAPVSWVPLIYIKVFRDEVFIPFIICGVMVAGPLLVLITYMDSSYYSMKEFNGEDTFEWTITGYNFIRSNLIEKKSEYFGIEPMNMYVAHYFPKYYSIMFPVVVFGIFLFIKEQL